MADFIFLTPIPPKKNNPVRNHLYHLSRAHSCRRPSPVPLPSSHPASCLCPVQSTKPIALQTRVRSLWSLHPNILRLCLQNEPNPLALPLCFSVVIIAPATPSSLPLLPPDRDAHQRYPTLDRRRPRELCLSMPRLRALPTISVLCRLCHPARRIYHSDPLRYPI